MPITVKDNLTRLSQREFAAVAYDVMREAFALHEEFGYLFDETVYRNALVDRVKGSVAEVQIDVTFQDFRKLYFMDIVVSNGGVFELKAVEKLNANHRSQLLNYLLLCEMAHGKLINFGSERVEHEFVNTSWTLAERRNFSVDAEEWTATDGFGQSEKSLVCDMLRDWGTGLHCTLYNDALSHFLGGQDGYLKKVDVFHNGKCVAHQVIPCCGISTTLHLTTFQSENTWYQHQLMRLIQTTRIESAQWINIARKNITFKTLHFSVPNFSV